MVDFLVLVWLLSLVGVVLGAINLFKAKRKGKTKFTSKQAKTILITSIVISFISFISIGVLTPSVEETPNNTVTLNSIENQEENNIENNVTENIVEEKVEKDFTEDKKQALLNIPSYANSAYTVINNNVPFFNDSELTTNSYENYSSLDNLGRCGVAISCIGKDIMPTEERGNIGSVKPTGWHTVKYNGIDGNYLYNRCHLIGYQLTAENANEKNLITGTRYMNVSGMLPFENMVADYIKETNNHVLYRVTPIFEGNNLLASGVLMEAKSVEDNGKGIQFNVYCYNVQPGIEINYATGESSGPEYTGSTTSNQTTTSSSSTSSSSTSNSDSSNSETVAETKPTETSTSNNETTSTYILNTNTKKFHKPNCSSAKKISDKNRKEYNGSRSALISQGYDPCKNCNP